MESFKFQAPNKTTPVEPDMSHFKSRFPGVSRPEGGGGVKVSPETLEKITRNSVDSIKPDFRVHPKTEPVKQEVKVEPKAEPKVEAKVEVKTEVAPKSDKPSWLPDKFKTPEDMAKAYVELEAKLGKSDKTEVKTDSKPEPKAKEEAKTEAPKTVDFTPYHEELLSNGGLSEQSYGKLESMGYPKELVNSFIAGQQALRQAEVSQIHGAAEGKESFDKMVEWANANLDDKELELLNASVNDANIGKAVQAVKGLYAQYKNSNKEYKPLKGSNNAALIGYASKTEWIDAIKDPRYAKDKTYREQVAAKRSASGF